MKKYLKVNGEEFTIDYNGTDDTTGKASITVYNTWWCKTYNLKVYYRYERTWNDHMGNTPCGYYVNINLPFNAGKKRFYLYS